MATAIAITEVSRYMAGDNPTATTGDQVEDHTVDVSRPVLLIGVNKNASTTTSSIALVASAYSWNDTTDIPFVAAAEAGGVNGVSAAWIEVPSDMVNSDGTVNLTSADANLGDTKFYALTGIRSV